MDRLKEIFNTLWFSFPVQLFFLHIKKHQVLTLFWVMLFLVISGNFGAYFGIPYLFLDPEYLGNVDYLSFSIVGIAFGGFWMTWNISTYILHTHRFPFMAALEHPLMMYCINNSLLPLSFISTYMILMVRFQNRLVAADFKSLSLMVLGFLAGVILIVAVTAVYFMSTNRTVINVIQKTVRARVRHRVERRVVMKKDRGFEDIIKNPFIWRVDTFVSSKLRWRNVRNVEHYDDSIIQSVFRQHHFNALLIMLGSLATIIALGLLIEYRFFRIPAGSSVLIFLSLLMMLSGALHYWLGGWKNIFLILFLVLINVLVTQNYLSYDNQAYGLDYSQVPPAEFTYSNLDSLSSEANVMADKQITLDILNKWKQKNGQEKPDIIFINTSGGGLAAAMFTTRLLQVADSLMQGEVLDHTAMITGASGGMFGAAYLRELYLQRKQSKIASLYRPQYAYNIAKDILNPLCFTILVNDIFYPWQTFEYAGETYRKDRGYIFEQVLVENSSDIMDKRIMDYKDLEMAAEIPMMIVSTTVINDARRMYISPVPVSYLTRPLSANSEFNFFDVDGIEFMRFFEEQQSRELPLSTALRMNGTFPYILPAVFMPSEPVMQVMDAGFRDNYGLETTLRFIHVFQDWILENVDRVVLIQVRGHDDSRTIEEHKAIGFINRLLSPAGTVYKNHTNLQEFSQESMIAMTNTLIEGKLDWIIFEYTPEKLEEKTALSMHLTKKEKLDIMRSVNTKENMDQIDHLKSVLK